MERITERIETNKIILTDGNATDKTLWGRLAEYEDIGLTPEEITLRLRELGRLKAQITKINELSRKARCAITELAAEAEIHA